MKATTTHLKAALVALSTLFLLAACGNNEPSNGDTNNQGNQKGQGPMASEDTVSYELGDVNAQVSTSQAPLGFNAVQLSTISSGCANEPRQEYFQDLISRFEGANAQRTVYNFKYQGETQGTGTYQVFILPNVPKYKSMADFEKDFKSCSPAVRTQPAAVSKEWLLFTSACAPAGNADSTAPNGCMEIKNQVDPTLELE